MSVATLPARIYQVRLEASDTISLELRAAEATTPLPVAAPGAHIDLHLAPGLVRSYSLIHTEAPGRYTVAVLRDRASRGGSQHVHEKLRVGQVIQISVPRNHFALHEDAPESVLLAGGIGITPLYAMLERLAHLGRRAHLIYCARSRSDAAFVNEIEMLLSTQSQLSVHFHWNDEQGAAPDLSRLLSGFGSDAHFYCCGPGLMLDAYEKACAQLGYRHVHMERFAALAPAPGPSTPSEGYTVELKKSGKSVHVPAGTSLLDALLAAGCNVEYSCREGTCGACETRVVSGEVEHRDSILTGDERTAGKFMMICVSGCRSSHLVLDA